MVQYIIKIYSVKMKIQIKVTIKDCLWDRASSL